jgi:hypothetical protein
MKYLGTKDTASDRVGTKGELDKAYTRTINFIVDGGGQAITTGSKGFCHLDFACTIMDWTIVSDVSGSAVVDVKRATYANFPTTASIAGTAKPTLSSAQKNQNTTLTGWGSTAIADGDVLEFVVDSAATVTRLCVSLKVVVV